MLLCSILARLSESSATCLADVSFSGSAIRKLRLIFPQLHAQENVESRSIDE